MHFRTAGFLTSLVFLCCLSVSAQYAGRFTDGRDYAVYFEDTPYGFTIRPVMWSATQLLRETAKDTFEVVGRASRGAEFRRDAAGRIVGVTIRGMEGEGLELRRASGPPLPVELLLAGKARAAADAYVGRGETTKAVETAERILQRLPTKTGAVVAFLRHLAPRLANDASFHKVLGYALVQARDRRSAVVHLKRSHEIDPRDSATVSALARLNSLAGLDRSSGWKIPFALDSVFASPTSAEIAQVEREWASRKLAPEDVREEARSELKIDGRSFDVRIVSHLVHGFRHYGAILTPSGGAKRLPVIIDAKGVSPTYFPLNLEAIETPRMIGSDAGNFMYVVPSYRGEVLNFQGKTYISEGDRTDALDGATDDTLALLNVALTLPSADPTRICAYGRSRGGNVVMLAGIRDPRIKCIVNVAGPTDWFHAMGTGGWTEQELWAEGLRTRATPLETGGQNIERFLKAAIDGRASLSDVRRRMIASSPLYFAHRLPPSLHHYGIEDPSVPVRNGRELVERMRKHGIKIEKMIGRGKSSASYQAFFYPDQGHDTDRLFMPVVSRGFMIRQLK